MKNIMQGIKMLLNREFIRFLIAGGVNVLFSFVSFSVLMRCIGIKEVAVTLNLFIAVFFNYNTSSRFVFNNNHMSIKQIFKFYIVYFVTYPLNLLHLYITVDLLSWNVYLSQVTTLLYLPLISFLLQRRLIFQDRKEKEEEGK